MLRFSSGAWEAKHAWLLGIVGGVHFDMWDAVVSREDRPLAFLTLPVHVEPKVNLSTRWSKYSRGRNGGGRLCA